MLDASNPALSSNRSSETLRNYLPWIRRAVLVVAWIAACSPCRADEIYVEAESFQDHGGWSLDTAFTHIVGSPYLLAHGLGKPTKDATTSFTVARDGKYRLWVRTKIGSPIGKRLGSPDDFK